MSEDAVGDLRTILDDALDRIKAEVFGKPDATQPQTPHQARRPPPAGLPGDGSAGGRPRGRWRPGPPPLKTGSQTGHHGVKIGSCLVP